MQKSITHILKVVKGKKHVFYIENENKQRFKCVTDLVFKNA